MLLQELRSKKHIFNLINWVEPDFVEKALNKLISFEDKPKLSDLCLDSCKRF